MNTRLTDDEKIRFIAKKELEITQAILNGHKASDDDQYEEIRKTIHQYRVDLGIIKNQKKMELNKIYNEDCISGLKSLPENSVDLILTSPPYNLNIDYKDHKDSMSLESYYRWCKEWIVECYRVLKEGGRFCLQIGCFQPQFNEPSYAKFTNLFTEAGFTFREFIIWNKNQIPKRTAWGSWLSPSNPRILPPFEMIINFHKGSSKILQKGESDLEKEEFINWTNGLWVIAPESAKKRKHPAPFPEELAKRCIKMHSYIDSVVLDPFNGSGTTTYVANKLGRKWIGFDITKEYCQLAEERINSSIEIEI